MLNLFLPEPRAAGAWAKGFSKRICKREFASSSEIVAPDDVGVLRERHPGRDLPADWFNGSLSPPA